MVFELVWYLGDVIGGIDDGTSSLCSKLWKLNRLLAVTVTTFFVVLRYGSEWWLGLQVRTSDLRGSQGILLRWESRMESKQDLPLIIELHLSIGAFVVEMKRSMSIVSSSHPVWKGQRTGGVVKIVFMGSWIPTHNTCQWMMTLRIIHAQTRWHLSDRIEVLLSRIELNCYGMSLPPLALLGCVPLWLLSSSFVIAVVD